MCLWLRSYEEDYLCFRSQRVFFSIFLCLCLAIFF